MLKYFIKKIGCENEEEISSRDYEDYLIDDAFDCGESKTTALRVIRENRKEARDFDECDWVLTSGNKVIVKKV
mgnify:CR=1 FL=1